MADLKASEVWSQGTSQNRVGCKLELPFINKVYGHLITGADGLLLWGFRGEKGYMTAKCPRLMSQWPKVTQVGFSL